MVSAMGLPVFLSLPAFVFKHKGAAGLAVPECLLDGQFSFA
jgi:hypothetical protein